MITLDHLNPEVKAIAMLPANDRLCHLNKEKWIGYTRANQIIAQMETLLTYEPGKLRPKNLLLVSPSNNGKTKIAEKFLKSHPPKNADHGNNEIIPVLMVQMPSKATHSRLFYSLLSALGTPINHYGRIDIREEQTLQIMRTVEVRMLIIDEVHNLLDTSARQQREMLNLLRYLGNELRIPIVCLGIREAYLAIRSDDQLENRFHPVVLPLWEQGLEFARLLASLETLLPLQEPSNLPEKNMSKRILEKSEGTIGEIISLLTHVATDALLQGKERITAELIENTDYNPPSIRRRIIERELR